MIRDDITLNADDAAALLHAESETILQYARSGELPGTRIGKSWVFMRDDVIAFLRKQISHDTEQRLRTKAAPLAVALQPKQNMRRRPPPALPSLKARIGYKDEPSP